MSVRRFSGRVGMIATVAAGALAASPAVSHAQSACGGSYVVQTGNTLADIAAQCGVTLPALLAANPAVRDEEDLRHGRRIAIPDPRTPQPTPREACGAFYTIRSSDTLADVAAKCGIPIPLLVAANPGLPERLDNTAGQRLRIPDVPRVVVTDGGRLIIAGAGDTASYMILRDVSDPAADTTAASPELLRFEGVLIRGGPCARVRTRSGIIEVAGQLGDAFRPGDRLVILGMPTQADACSGPTVVELRIAWKAGSR